MRRWWQQLWCQHRWSSWWMAKIEWLPVGKVALVSECFLCGKIRALVRDDVRDF